MAEIPDGSVSLVASSPPFIALRSYLPADHPDKHLEIGSEPDPGTFLDTLLALTAEWGRVLAPWGSIAIELGDTFAGSGGAGGDYNAGGLREGQNAFVGSSSFERRTDTKQPRPRPKCLTLIPQAYAMSLAYGFNVITGQPSPAGQWLVRNQIVWHRPNPAVGALGDKFRPSTSYITVATRSATRWFDLTAVRTEAIDQRTRTTNGQKKGPVDEVLCSNYDQRIPSNAAGAPPLDCWFDHHDTWTLTTQPSRIKVEVVTAVPCGPDDGGVRTTSPDCPVHGDQTDPAPTAPDDEPQADQSPTPHTPCTSAHHEQEPSALDVDDASIRSCAASTATRRSTSSHRTDLDPSTSPLGTPSAQTAARTTHTSTSHESSACHLGTSGSSSGEVCLPAAEPEKASHTSRTSCPESACTCSFHLDKTSIHSHYAMWPAKLAERIILSMCPAWVCRQCGEPRRRVEGVLTLDSYRGSERTQTRRAVALADAGGLTDAHIAAVRAFGTSDAGKATSINSGNGKNSDHVKLLAGEAKVVLGGYFREFVMSTNATLSSTWSDCGHDDYTPGTVLDPFCGTGTTLAVGDLHGRNSIGIDIDERNHDLLPARLIECKRSLFGTPAPMPGQMDMFEGDVA
jgi:hypothetical protein